MGKKRFKYSDFCQSCRQALGADDKVVYVEENSPRFFCSEKCIRDYYDPMADFYRNLMLELRDPHDVSESDFPAYESYAPLCLADPDEIWVDTTELGEQITIFLANFTNEGGKFTYLVMGFCMDLEPTYILLSFPTRDKKLVEEFRRGERVERLPASEELAEPEVSPMLSEDFLARQGNAIEEEMLRHRSKNDIPAEDFEEYGHYLEQTIENPDEVWELQDDSGSTLLTLIAQQEESLFYLVICTSEQGSEGQESWRVIYSFPTNDQALVQRYRRGVIREGAAARASFLH